MICVERVVISLVLVCRKPIHFNEDNARKTIFIFFVPSDLDLRPFYFKFVSLVTLVQHYISTELEVSMAFLFGENPKHGTDGQRDGQDATPKLLNAAYKEAA